MNPGAGSGRIAPATLRVAARLCLGLLCTLVPLSPASAHTRSETRSSWRIAGATVHLVFIVPDAEAARLDEHGGAPTDERLGGYLGERVGANAGGARCRPDGRWRALVATPGYRRFEWTFRCPTNQGMTVWSRAFLELVPSHTHFAQVETAEGGFAATLLTADHPEVPVGAAAMSPLQEARLPQFVALGIMHILTGPDHVSFLIGLILISRRLRDLVLVVTGFTVGHSITLALAVSGLLRPYPQYIDALVALTIVLIGAENIVARAQRAWPVAAGFGGLLAIMCLASAAGIGRLPPLLLLGSGLFAANYLALAGRIVDAARMRLVVTCVFGLIHGFGFASDLIEMRMPKGRLAELLLGFNLGVEIGQLGVVLLVIGAAALALRLRTIAIPRERLAPVLAAVLIAIGLYWFVTRCYA